MVLAARMDEQFGKGGWIAAMVLGFVLYWPVGLAILAFLVFSGRMRGWRHRGGPGRWHYQPQDGRGEEPLWMRNWGCGGRNRQSPSSGNRAFDEYRADTLKRLEEEQREFVEYLERLRQAKDKQEFDQFMAERRNRNTPPIDPNAGPTA